MIPPFHPSGLVDWATGILKSWLDRLTSGTPLSDDEVHQLRLATKHLRAVWAMAKPSVGDKTCESGIKEMKKLAQYFSGNRDATVQHNLVKKLVEKRKQALAPALEESLRNEFIQHFESKSLENSEVAKILRQSLKRWESCRSRLADTSALEKGMAESLQTLCDKLKEALEEDSPKLWHKCRKWVKYAYFQSTVMAELSGRSPADYTDGLKKLGDILGKRNDLDNLLATLKNGELHEQLTDDHKRLKKWTKSEDRALAVQATETAQKLLEQHLIPRQNLN